MIRKWKIVPSKQELEVSNFGEVRYTKTKELLKIYLTGNYPGIWLGKKAYEVHRLMMETFFGPANGLWTNHKDGNKHNNNLENLEYVTPKENEWHKRFILGKNNIPPARPGSKNGWAKLNEDQVTQIRELYKTGKYTYKEIANKFNVKPACIAPIVQGKGWKHIDPDYVKPIIIPNRKIKVEQVRIVKRLQREGKSPKEISDYLNLPYHMVYFITIGKTWRNVE